MTQRGMGKNLPRQEGKKCASSAHGTCKLGVSHCAWETPISGAQSPDAALSRIRKDCAWKVPFL